MIKLGDLEKLAVEIPFRGSIHNVFFEAMNAGYASTDKPQKGKIAELAGSKLVPPYVRGPWKVVDVYLVTPLSLRSGGMTVISYEGVAVWQMQYFGEYDEVAVPCLKAALRAAYSTKDFVGGRGPLSFRHDGFYYRNKVDHWDFWNFFQGKETVTDERNKECGWHSYQGGTML